MTERRDGHSKLVWDKETRSFKTVDPHPETWRQSDEAIRNLIAAEIWAYQELDQQFGAIDGPNPAGVSTGAAALAWAMCTDEAERIRKVILESPVVRARFLAVVGGTR